MGTCQFPPDHRPFDRASLVHGPTDTREERGRAVGGTAVGAVPASMEPRIDSGSSGVEVIGRADDRGCGGRPQPWRRAALCHVAQQGGLPDETTGAGC